MDFVRDAMFDCVVKQLFGHDNVPANKVSTRQCSKFSDNVAYAAYVFLNRIACSR